MTTELDSYFDTPVNQKKHAFLSPSSAHRWTECAASPTLESFFQPQIAALFADEGTFAHGLLEEAVDKRMAEAERLAGCEKTLNGRTHRANAEVIDALDMCLGYVEDNLDGYGDFPPPANNDDFSTDTEGKEPFVLKTEVSLDLSKVTGEKGGKGTADILFYDKYTEALVLDREHQKFLEETHVIDDHPDITIVDFKYGKEPVVAQNNPQLMLYATAAALQYDARSVKTVIVQPRSIKGAKITECKYSRAELLEYHNGNPPIIKKFADASAKALSARDMVAKGYGIPADYFCPSEKVCKYCKAKPRCPALNELSNSILAPLEKPNYILPIEELPRMYEKIPILEAFIKSVRETMFNELKEGRPVEGYKLATGALGNRAFIENTENLTEFIPLKTEELFKAEIESEITRVIKTIKDPKTKAETERSLRESLMKDFDEKLKKKIEKNFELVRECGLEKRLVKDLGVEAYKTTLINPTTAKKLMEAKIKGQLTQQISEHIKDEKLLKKEVQSQFKEGFKKQWGDVYELFITRPPGKPIIVEDTDERPALAEREYTEFIPPVMESITEQKGVENA